MEKRRRLSLAKEKGFTLVEAVISIGIFVILFGAAYQILTVMVKGTETNRAGVSVSSLADQYLELARNLPYSQVGTLSGSPHGSLPDLPNELTVSYNSGTYHIYYDVTLISDPADPLYPDSNDYKQVKLSITNTQTSQTYYFLTTIVPQGLTSTPGGALSLSVIDADGNPVPYANLAITSIGITPSISLSRTANAAGDWIEVGLTPGTNAYHIVATGPTTGPDAGESFSTDSTNPIVSGTNPNPTKPDATITNGSTTAVNFSIDQTSTLTVNTENTLCAPLGSIGFQVRGAKIIGTSPSVYKNTYSGTTNGSGTATLSNIEWDTYTPAVVGTTYMLYGSSPAQQITLLPNTSQAFTYILGAFTTNSLLVVVEDGSGNPLQNASVALTSSSPSYSATEYTGGSLLSQSSWSGGSGQALFSNASQYFSDNGDINNTSGVQLSTNGSGEIISPGSGSLISSTFDTGTTATEFTTLTWKPTSQTSPAVAQFQIATSNSSAGPWNFHGPDGTSSTYFTSSGSSINATDANARYIRYEIFETGATTSPNWKHIPVVTSVGINYVSGCATPGQVVFSGLSAGSSYTLTISLSGYSTKTITGVSVGATTQYNSTIVTMTP